MSGYGCALALGATREATREALVCPVDTYQYPRGSHVSWATIITARDCCQSGMGSLGISGYPWVSLGIPGYLWVSRGDSGC